MRTARLIPVRPASQPVSGDKKLELVYDYIGRRVEKRVIPWNPNLGENGDWDEENPDSVRRFIYYNWLPVLELEGGAGGPPAGVPGRRFRVNRRVPVA